MWFKAVEAKQKKNEGGRKQVFENGKHTTVWKETRMYIATQRTAWTTVVLVLTRPIDIISYWLFHMWLHEIRTVEAIHCLFDPSWD